MFVQLPRPRMTCPNSLTINLIQRLPSTIRIRMFLTVVNDDDCATTLVSARFSVVGSDQEDHIPAQTDFSMPASAEIIDEGRTVAGSICSAGVGIGLFNQRDRA